MTSRLIHTRIPVQLGENPLTIQSMKPWKTRKTKGSDDSLKVWMGNSRIEFQCLILVFKDSCGALNVDVVGSVEPMEQRNVWQQGKQYQWLASLMILSAEEAEKSVTTGQGHHTIDHLEKEGRKKRQWSTIYIQSTADGTKVNRISNYCQCNIRDRLSNWVAHIWTFLNIYTVSRLEWASRNALYTIVYLHKNNHTKFITAHIVTFQNRVTLTDLNIVCSYVTC